MRPISELIQPGTFEGANRMNARPEAEVPQGHRQAVTPERALGDLLSRMEAVEARVTRLEFELEALSPNDGA